jgi:thioredoxin reductase (NADPH)
MREESEPVERKLVIIGGGPAGYTAGIYAARANLKPLVLEGLVAGGQLSTTPDVENYSGFPDPVGGSWLMERMREQAVNVGAELCHDIVTDIDPTRRPFRIETEDGATYLADTVILATGAQPKWLGLNGETEYYGRGVSACATCDGAFFRDQKVAVVGGGDTAVEEAIYLSALCAQVTLIHRRDTLRAGQVLQDRLFEHQNIDVIWDSTIEDIIGNGDEITGVVLHNQKTHTQSVLDLDGVFIAIGHTPATEIIAAQIDTDSQGYVKTQCGSTHTSIDGFFAAGDVQDPHYRQAITAAASGCMAALDAEKFLNGI